MALTAIRAAYDPVHVASETTYNGWRNKPTWLVHLWLTNEAELAAEAAQHVEAHQDGRHAPWCDLLDEHGTGHPDDWLRVHVEGYLQDHEGVAPRGLGWDLLSWALASVDWDEVAEALAPEVEPACPACGDPIDYCTGQGEIGDPAGFAILVAHDAGDHADCHRGGCDDAD